MENDNTKRPRLKISEEEYGLRRKQQMLDANKKYQKKHPDVVKNYEANFQKIILRIPKHNKKLLKTLVKQQNTTYSELFMDLILKEFGIDLKN